MTVRERVARTARLLATVAALRGVLIGSAVALSLVALAQVAGVSAGPAVVTVAAAVGLAVAVVVFRRVRGPGFTLPTVSLWIEEHVPSLGYALVTAIEPGPAAAMHRTLAGADWTPATRAATRQALGWPAVAAALAIALVVAAPTLSRVLPGVVPRVGRTGIGPAGDLDVTVQVLPPAYTRQPPVTLRRPSVVTALVGSRLRLEAAGRESLLVAIGDSAVQGGRTIAWTVGPRPVVLRMATAGASRLVAIDPVPDSAPVVVLRGPARDTVLAAAAGQVTLGAEVRDDHGVRRARFEYIVSSGSGESFTFLAGTLSERTFDGAPGGAISGRLDLASLRLKPGDFVHLRAVATDLRDDTLLASGTSETRTIRVARAGEMDSVAVDAAAPPEADKAVLSQRMLINLAESLVRRRARLGREAFAGESRTIAGDQARLRKQVGDIVFSRLGDDPSGEHFHGDGHAHEGQELRPPLTPEELLKAAENATMASAGQVLDFEGDETPVVAVNRPLLEAYNFMWEAGRELGQAAPERALPAMYRALEAIQRARAAERLYLRARAPRAVVDVERARLQGREVGTPGARAPREPAPAAAAGRAVMARLARAVDLARLDPLAAADSLLMLRMDLVGAGPPAAAVAAAAAADEWRRGRDAAAPLAHLRRLLSPAMRAGDSLPRWGAIP